MRDTADLLRGNGVGLVRERELARRVQRALARLYVLEHTEDVRDFIEPAREGEREQLLVRESDDGLELALRLAPLAGSRDDLDLDGLCQLIEGVSHFVYISARAHAERPATQLELEIQAEVDKYVVLAAAMNQIDVARSGQLRARLYDRVAFVHDAATEHGDRYRVANDVAKRFTRKLERQYLARSPARIGEMRGALRAFFHMGQAQKISAA